MKRKKDAVNKAAHIKANTLGTSNELSFDVLEAAKNRLDSKDGLSNEVVIKKPGKSVGVISLLFSKIPFHSRKDTENGAVVPSADASTGQTVQLSSAVQGDKLDSKKASSSPETLSFTPIASSAGLAGTTLPDSSGSGRKKRKKEKKQASEAARKPLLTEEDTRIEIDRRKKIRRRHRVRVRLAAAVVIFAALGVGGYMIAQQIQLRTDQSSTFDSAVSAISEVDTDLVVLDELLANPLVKVTDPQWPETRERLNSMRDKLGSSVKKAEILAEEGSTNELRVAARQIIVACEARQAMIDVGEQIFTEASKANDISAQLDSTWATVLTADSTARAAAELLGSSTLDGPMQEAIAKFEDASSQFNEAYQEIERIEEGYANIDLSSYKAYLAYRIEAVGYGIQTAQALVNRDKASASAFAELFNSADGAAVTAATALPSTFKTPVENAFNANIAQYQQQYSEARLNASAADDVIRDYLGVHNK